MKLMNNPGNMIGEMPHNYDMAMQEHLQDDEQLLKQLIQKKMMLGGEAVQTNNAAMGSGQIDLGELPKGVESAQFVNNQTLLADLGQ